MRKIWQKDWQGAARITGIWLAALLLMPDGVQAANRQPPAYYSQITRRVAQYLPGDHLTRHPLDDDMAGRVWTNYFNTLDYEHVFFTGDDISRFQSVVPRLDDMLQNGDTAFAYEVYEVFLARVRDRYAYVQELLKAGFDVHANEVYQWKRKDQPWPVDGAEWNELWRRRVKNEYVQRLVNRELADAERARKAAEQPPATNAAGVSPTGGVNQASADLSAEREMMMTPEAFIANRYKQLLTVLEDADAEGVLQRYLQAFAMAYDPHSGYMSPSTAEDFAIEMKLSLVGIGARLRSEDGAAKIDEVIPGGPADQDKRDVRLRAGDKIIAVAQAQREPVNVLHWPLDKVVKLIRGEKGTRVVLTVIPATDPTGSTTKQVDLIRDEVKLEEQAAKGEVQSVVGADGNPRKFGIIRLPSFYANMQAESVFSSDYRSATDDVRKIIENLQTQGIEGVILDLRNNGGGSLVEAIRMTGLFISMGPVVQVRERFGVRVLQDRESDLVYDGPLMVLVSRMSASASEIVAGALQDYGRAIIVGDSKTHGKGSVQTVLDLGSDKKLGELRLTTASYYRISGGSTQLKGIAADIVLPSPFGAMDIGEEYQPYALEWSTVARVGYKPVSDLTPVVDRLRARTLGRQQVDPRFTAYRQSLDRIQAINNSKELPLNIETRREWARTEKELAEIEEKLMDETKSDDGKGKAPDVVLAEALNMASDWAVWRAEQPEMPVEAVAAPAETVSWLRAIWDHIRFFFRSLVDYVQQCAR